jgi:tetratricopeptide (TPR) repeat protein
VRLKPDLASLHDNLGTVLVELGRFNEATNEFDQAARLDPAYPWPHLEMGKALLQEGRDGGAISQFREALRLDPENFQILAYVAHVLAAEENPEIRDGPDALLFAAKANALTGGQQPLVLDAFGMACAEAGRFDDAQELTQKAIKFADAAGMKKDAIAAMQQRLELYKNHQPWRESFLFTNGPPKELQKN